METEVTYHHTAKLLRDIGQVWTNAENLTKARKSWKAINERMKFIEDWEDQMAYTMREEEKLDGIERMKDFFSVQLGGRGKGCLAKGGRTQHERRMHQIPNKQEFVSEMQKKNIHGKTI